MRLWQSVRSFLIGTGRSVHTRKAVSEQIRALKFLDGEWRDAHDRVSHGHIVGYLDLYYEVHS